MNFKKILLHFSSFKMNFIKIQLNSIILKKNRNIQYNFRKVKIEFQKIQLLFSKFKKQIINFLATKFQILVSGNSETCSRNNFTFQVTEVLCSYMQLKILL